MDPKERFYRQFHQEIAVLQGRIARLGALSVVGGEWQDAKESILASISQLSLDVADAADYIPAYDQRNCAQAVKALTNQLNEELAGQAPKSRFQFKKTARPAASAAPVADPRLLRGAPRPADLESDRADKTETDAPPSSKNYSAEMAAATASSAVRSPSFSAAREIALSNLVGLHIVLPPSAAHATASGSLTGLRSCVVDMSVPTASAAFLSLVLKDMDRCLVLAGHVSGPVHITGLRDSIVVVAARQVRIHECHHVDVYLHCASRPIIEDCSAMRFAPLPQAFGSAADAAATNHWDAVDDFKWLKADHSPNWCVLPEADRLSEDVWTGVTAGAKSTADVLASVGI